MGSPAPTRWWLIILLIPPLALYWSFDWGVKAVVDRQLAECGIQLQHYRIDEVSLTRESGHAAPKIHLSGLELSQRVHIEQLNLTLQPPGKGVDRLLRAPMAHIEAAGIDIELPRIEQLSFTSPSWINLERFHQCTAWLRIDPLRGGEVEIDVPLLHRQLSHLRETLPRLQLRDLRVHLNDQQQLLDLFVSNIDYRPPEAENQSAHLSMDLDGELKIRRDQESLTSEFDAKLHLFIPAAEEKRLGMDGSHFRLRQLNLRSPQRRIDNGQLALNLLNMDLLLREPAIDLQGGLLLQWESPPNPTQPELLQARLPLNLEFHHLPGLTQSPEDLATVAIEAGRIEYGPYRLEIPRLGILAQGRNPSDLPDLTLFSGEQFLHGLTRETPIHFAFQLNRERKPKAFNELLSARIQMQHRHARVKFDLELLSDEDVIASLNGMQPVSFPQGDLDIEIKIQDTEEYPVPQHWYDWSGKHPNLEIRIQHRGDLRLDPRTVRLGTQGESQLEVQFSSSLGKFRGDLTFKQSLELNPEGIERLKLAHSPDSKCLAQGKGQLSQWPEFAEFCLKTESNSLLRYEQEELDIAARLDWRNLPQLKLSPEFLVDPSTEGTVEISAEGLSLEQGRLNLNTELNPQVKLANQTPIPLSIQGPLQLAWHPGQQGRVIDLISPSCLKLTLAPLDLLPQLKLPKDTALCIQGTTPPLLRWADNEASVQARLFSPKKRVELALGANQQRLVLPADRWDLELSAKHPLSNLNLLFHGDELLLPEQEIRIADSGARLRVDVGDPQCPRSLHLWTRRIQDTLPNKRFPSSRLKAHLRREKPDQIRGQLSLDTAGLSLPAQLNYDCKSKHLSLRSETLQIPLREDTTKLLFSRYLERGDGNLSLQLDLRQEPQQSPRLAITGQLEDFLLDFKQLPELHGLAGCRAIGGKIRFKAALEPLAPQRGKARLALDTLTLATKQGTLVGIDSPLIQLDSLDPPLSRPFDLSIAEIHGFLPFRKADMQLQLAAENRLEINNLRMLLATGQVRAPKARLEDWQSGHIDLYIKGLDLGELAAELQPSISDRLKMQGKLDGNLPLEFQREHIHLNQGHLRTQGAGHIRLKSPETQTRTNEGLLPQALTDFRFKHFELGLDGNTQRIMHMDLQLAGYNPEFALGAPIELELRINSELGKLFSIYKVQRD